YPKSKQTTAPLTFHFARPQLKLLVSIDPSPERGLLYPVHSGTETTSHGPPQWFPTSPGGLRPIPTRPETPIALDPEAVLDCKSSGPLGNRVRGLENEPGRGRHAKASLQALAGGSATHFIIFRGVMAHTSSDTHRGHCSRSRSAS